MHTNSFKWQFKCVHIIWMQMPVSMNMFECECECLMFGGLKHHASETILPTFWSLLLAVWSIILINIWSVLVNIRSVVVSVMCPQVWPGKTVFPDFSHPGAAEWWYQHANNFHKEIPYDGLWTVSEGVFVFSRTLPWIITP